MSNFVFQMWQFGITLWKFRNECIYSKTELEKKTKIIDELNKNIRQKYTHKKGRFDTKDLCLFDLPLESRLSQSPEQKKLWVASVNIAMSAWESTLYLFVKIDVLEYVFVNTRDLCPPLSLFCVSDSTGAIFSLLKRT